MPWTTRRVSRPIRMLMPRPPSRLRRPSRRPRRAWPPSRSGASFRSTAGLLRVRADDPDDHRHGALLAARASIRPRATSSPRVMPPKMLTRIAFTFGSAEDQAHRRGDLVGPRAAADVEEVRGLAAGALHEVHRRHREPGAVDHAADRAVELDEADAGLARLEVGRVLLVEVAQRLELGVAAAAPSRRA